MSPRLAAATLLLIGVAIVGCNRGSDSGATPVVVSTSTPQSTSAPTAMPTPTPSPAPTSMPTASPTSTPAPTPTPSAEELAVELALIVLAAITEEFGKNELDARALDLGVADADGTYWAVLTNGLRPFYVNDDGDPINFFHLVAVHGLNNDGSWSDAIDRIAIDTAPYGTDVAELVDLDGRAGGSAWIAIRDSTGAHAGTLDVIRFDGSRLSTALSHISSRPNAGTITDLDGDGVPEFVLNASNPYVFCYACAVEEHAVDLYRWDGAALRRVALAVPAGLAPGVAADAGRVVALAGADLWREAAALAVQTASGTPDDDSLRWLSILVNQLAAARLGHAGSPGQPLLTNVLAGEYAAALDVMRAHPPAEAFALDGPLIVGTAAETNITTMAVTILDYSERALAQRPDDASIHAVRALGLALASPDDLGQAREAAARALDLAPADEFLEQVSAFLEAAEGASCARYSSGSRACGGRPSRSQPLLRRPGSGAARRSRAGARPRCGTETCRARSRVWPIGREP